MASYEDEDIENPKISSGTHGTSTELRPESLFFLPSAPSASYFQVSLQTADGGQSGTRGVSEHDKDCGRLFIPDDTIQPLYAGFQDYVEIPQGRCLGQDRDSDSIDR